MLEKIVESLYNDWFSYEKTKKMSKEVRLKKIIEIARGVSYSSEEIDVENGINLVNLKRHYLL